MLHTNFLTSANMPTVAITIGIGAEQGCGKSTLGNTLPNALSLTFNPDTALIKKALLSGGKTNYLCGDFNEVSAVSLEEVVSYENTIHDFDYITVDTVGELVEVATKHIITNASTYRQEGGRAAEYKGELTQNGYGYLGKAIASTLRQLGGIGRDMVWLFHNKKAEDNKMLTLDIRGSQGKQYVLNNCTIMAGIQIEQKLNKSGGYDEKRFLVFQKNEVFETKPLKGLQGKYEIPQKETELVGFLDEIFANAKEILNKDYCSVTDKSGNLVQIKWKVIEGWLRSPYMRVKGLAEKTILLSKHKYITIMWLSDTSVVTEENKNKVLEKYKDKDYVQELYNYITNTTYETT